MDIDIMNIFWMGWAGGLCLGIGIGMKIEKKKQTKQ